MIRIQFSHRTDNSTKLSFIPITSMPMGKGRYLFPKSYDFKYKHEDFFVAINFFLNVLNYFISFYLFKISTALDLKQNKLLNMLTYGQ